MYIGFTLASLVLVGKIPLSIVALITSVKGLHKIPADLETTLGGIKSFPAAFLGFKEAKILKMLFSFAVGMLKPFPFNCSFIDFMLGWSF